MHKLNKNRIDIRVKILSVLTVMFIAVAYLFVFSPYTFCSSFFLLRAEEGFVRGALHLFGFSLCWVLTLLNAS